MKNQVFKDKWSVHDYLEHYYSTPTITSDERVLLRSLVHFLRNNNQHFDDALEFGAGPTVHRIIPLVPYVKNIYMSDYLESNLQEINKWLKNYPGSYNWDRYINFILKSESKKINSVNVRRRSALARKKIKNLWTGDICKRYPIKKRKTFELVTSFYCADSITDSKVEWFTLMNNLYNLVVPGGWIFFSTLRKAKKYKVKNTSLVGANITESDIKKSLIRNSFILSSINIKVIPAPYWTEHGFNSIIIASAKKETYDSIT